MNFVDIPYTEPIFQKDSGTIDPTTTRKEDFEYRINARKKINEFYSRLISNKVVASKLAVETETKLYTESLKKGFYRDMFLQRYPLYKWHTNYLCK